jgi:hypothetical protein
MSRLIWDRLPIARTSTVVPVHGKSVVIHPYQFIAWVGIQSVYPSADAIAPLAFPAIVDTGCTSSFIISPHHLRDWCGIEWNQLPLMRSVERKHDSIPVPYRRANVALFKNTTGRRDDFEFTSPVVIEISEGIAVFGDGIPVGVDATRRLKAPRLPLLGMRTLASQGLRMELNSASMTCTLESIE